MVCYESNRSLFDLIVSIDDSGAEKHVICIVWAPFKWYAFYGSKRGQDRHDGEF